MDYNSVPASYILQSISTHISGYTDKSDDATFQKAKSSWAEESSLMGKMLYAAACEKLSAEKQHKYTTSGECV